MDLEDPEQEYDERMKKGRTVAACSTVVAGEVHVLADRSTRLIDLRKRAHRLAFQADLRNYRPQMVALGPG